MSSEGCGCCQPLISGTMPEIDNRPGLPAISYRLGTFLTFRQALLDELSRTPALAALRTRQPDDYAITVIELWSILADVLTFYQERIANEAFLGTARVRDSIVRLARLIDYQLGPGAATLTRLAFTLDAGQTLQLPQGLRAQSVPGQGEKPQKFETLDAILAAASLNAIPIRPLPAGINPLARGSIGGHLEAGAAGLAAGASIRADDRLLLFSATALETLEVESVTTDVDRLYLTWKRPIERSAWTLPTAVRRVLRSYRLFGHNATSTYMTPANDTSVTPVPGGIKWTLTVGGNATFILPQRDTLFLDGRYDELKPGTWVIVSVAGTQNFLAKITAVSTDSETVGAMTDTVTKITTFPAAVLTGVDRRTVLVHEIQGPPIRFSGYAYPPALSGSPLIATGRRIDATHIEVDQRIVKGALQAGTVVDVEQIETDRLVVLSDLEHPSTSASIQRRRITDDEITIAPTPDDLTTAAALGLDAGQGQQTLVRLGAEMPAQFFITRHPGEIAVTIGSVGPRTMPIAIASATTSADVWVSSGELQNRLFAADASPEFRLARTMVVDGRLAIVPGVAGAPVTVAPTANDATTARELGFDPSQSSLVRGLISPQLPFAMSLTDPQPVVAVTIGPFGPVQVPLPSGATTRSQLTGVLEQALNAASPLPVFAFARVRLVNDRLIVLAGPAGAAHPAYLAMDVRADAPFTLTTASAVLLANVARASHGSTVRDEPLGDGNPAAPFQAFALNKKPITFVPETAGVVSSLRVRVNQVLWQEVPTLFGHGPDEQVYRTQVADDGTMTVQFGDGREGARPPAGRRNIVATYREGSGLAGRVRAGAISTPLDRPKGLQAVTNPVPASGGADPETIAQARRNAPNTVRTFGRIVSLRDFEDEARGSGEVAKVRATWVSDGGRRAIHLTVAGQQGGVLGPDSLRRLYSSLSLRRDPNQELLLPDAFVRVPIVMAGTVQIDPARAADDVVAAARAAVLDGLGFEAIGFGQAVNLSYVYALVQRVPGVVAVDIDLLQFKDRSAAALAARRATVDPVQPRLRIFAARPNAAPPPRVLPAEQAWIETPDTDVIFKPSGGLGR